MNKNFLRALLSTISVSGYESNGRSAVEGYCGDFAKFEFSDAVGNTCFSVGNGAKRLMLSGHIDEIGLQVQYIDDKGFIYFIADGGIDVKALIGANVTIVHDGKQVNGVIGKAPIHIEHSNDDKDKMPKIKELKIDIGAEDKAEAQKLVSIGDLIVVGSLEPKLLGANRFTSRGCDDKVGVFVMCEVLKELSKHELKNLTVYGVACTQEEVGGLGAQLASKRIDPHYSIDYDVTFATDDEHVDAKEWGDIQLGKGGAIAHGTDNNPWFVKFIKNVAIKNSIPYQEFALESGCTDTLPIKLGANNVLSALLSIPNRNMHTQVEVCDFRDLQSLIDMTVASILALDDFFNN